jgi:hypothetical protein
VAWWERKKKLGKTTPSISPRQIAAVTSRVDVGSLAPPLADYVASAAALQLTLAGELAAASLDAWSAQDADDLIVASGVAMDRYRAFRAILADYVEDVSDALAPPRDKISRHFERFQSSRWYEDVATVYVVTGFTRDFWHLLASGLPDAMAARLQDILVDRGDEALMAGVLERLLQVDTRYSSRLSLWCRRLVGDAMLIARDALAESVTSSADAEVRLEPVFTDVVAHHTRRLDRLGLTA